jgi:integrase
LSAPGFSGIADYNSQSSRSYLDGQWSEFDLDEAAWRIPAERRKMRVQHIGPLRRQMMQAWADYLDALRVSGKAVRFPAVPRA